MASASSWARGARQKQARSFARWATFTPGWLLRWQRTSLNLISSFDDPIPRGAIASTPAGPLSHRLKRECLANDDELARRAGNMDPVHIATRPTSMGGGELGERERVACKAGRLERRVFRATSQSRTDDHPCDAAICGPACHKRRESCWTFVMTQGLLLKVCNSGCAQCWANSLGA